VWQITSQGARPETGDRRRMALMSTILEVWAPGRQLSRIAFVSACPQAPSNTLRALQWARRKLGTYFESRARYLATGCETVSSWGTLEVPVFVRVDDTATPSRDPRKPGGSGGRAIFLRHMQRQIHSSAVGRNIRRDGERRLDRTCLTRPGAGTSIP